MFYFFIFISKYGDVDFCCLVGCSMKMDYVKIMFKKIVKLFFMLMIEEIKYSIKKSFVCNVMKEERLVYLKLVL